jgi:hypothetical protein
VGDVSAAGAVVSVMMDMELGMSVGAVLKFPIARYQPRQWHEFL